MNHRINKKEVLPENGVMQRGHMENNLNNFYNKIQRFAGTIASSRPMQT